MNAHTPGLSDANRAVHDACERELAARLEPLPDQPAETVATTLAALWHAAAGQPKSARAAAGTTLPGLDEVAQERLRSLVRRRLDGTPLAHLTGRQHFMGLEMIASPDALVPREETQLLGDAALERLRGAVRARGEARAIDVCTGSGNLALALAWHEPRARLWGADLSAPAIALANRNAAFLGLADRVAMVEGDLLDPFDTPQFHGTIDLVVCNPPYISSARVATMPLEIRDHEPRLAFDGGPFGIRILARLIDQAPAVLRAGGVLAFEVGLGQGPGLRRRLEKHDGYDHVAEIVDDRGQARALIAISRARNATAAAAP